ncbi:MAG TPA: F0F1 ATP synthase subunit B [Firmicutes bacterium]|nr:F0F1 ATP synthase subunit B [Bacillota bacterium]
MVQIDMTFFASIINFILLVALLGVFLYRPMKKFLKEREQLISRNISEAEADRREAARLKEEYEAHVAQARREVQDIIENAVREGERARDEIVEGARNEARRIVEKAEREARMREAKAWAELRDQLIAFSILAASKVASASLDQDSQEKIIKELLNDPVLSRMGDLL